MNTLSDVYKAQRWAQKLIQAAETQRWACPQCADEALSELSQAEIMLLENLQKPTYPRTEARIFANLHYTRGLIETLEALLEDVIFDGNCHHHGRMRPVW